MNGHLEVIDLLFPKIIEMNLFTDNYRYIIVLTK